MTNIVHHNVDDLMGVRWCEMMFSNCDDACYMLLIVLQMTGELCNREVVWQHEAFDRCLTLKSNEIVRTKLVQRDFQIDKKCFEPKPNPIDQKDGFTIQMKSMISLRLHSTKSSSLYRFKYVFAPLIWTIRPSLECVDPLPRIGS